MLLARIPVTQKQHQPIYRSKAGVCPAMDFVMPNQGDELVLLIQEHCVSSMSLEIRALNSVPKVSRSAAWGVPAEPPCISDHGSDRPTGPSSAARPSDHPGPTPHSPAAIGRPTLRTRGDHARGPIDHPTVEDPSARGERVRPHQPRYFSKEKIGDPAPRLDQAPNCVEPF